MFNPLRTIVTEDSPVSFEQFMEWALYHPETGYYRRPAETIFGSQGDFFTASQLQPAFGLLMDSLLPEGPVLELGPGRGEMRAAFEHRGYEAIRAGEELPAVWNGTIFANEFFDALPVRAAVRDASGLRELMVRPSASAYHWEFGLPLAAKDCGYVRRYYPELPEGGRFEIAERSIDAIRRLYRCLSEGTVLIVDYGWNANEYLRFPRGTLMSYRRHAAVDDVLANPGNQDITAHVPFPVLIDAARESGFTVTRFETLAQTLVRAMERSPKLVFDREQLKTLLFGMGESFRTLWLQKSVAQ